MPGLLPHHLSLLASAGGVALAPGGELAAFTVTTVDVAGNRYRTRIWLADTDGGAPWPVSPGEGRDQLPTWSPDGRQLAWATKEPGGQRVVWTAPVQGPGVAGACARFDDEVAELAWAPDGRRLAVVARDRDRERYGPPGSPLAADRMPPRRVTTLLSRLNGEGFVVDRPLHLFVLAADGTGAPVLVTPGPYEVSGAAWSPDGRRIAFCSARHADWDLDLVRDLWTVTVDGPGWELDRLTPSDGAYSLPSWSPDGARLAYVVDPTPMSAPRHGRIGVIDVGGVPATLTDALDRNAAPHDGLRPPAWVGDEVVFAAEEHGALRLFAVAADGSRPARSWLGGDRTISSWDVTGPDAGRPYVAFCAGDPVTLPELHLAPLAGGVPAAEVRVTDLTAGLRREVALVAPERFTAVSKDGTEVECWAMAPPGRDGPRPTILNIHGGPFTQYGYVLFDEFQLQVGAGFGVVYCNPRGSSGYSEAWGRAVRWPEAADDPGSGWGGVDAEDVLAAVEEAGRRFDWVDTGRLGVQGGSYGGYLTSWLVGHDDRFRAAISERACNNLLTMESDSDIAGFFSSYVGRSHIEAPELYLRHSPVRAVRDMTTPVLIVHSEDDLRCPISQAEELFVALRLLGRDPELVRFPAESHELSRSGSPAHRIMRAELILEWFDRHLRA